MLPAHVQLVNAMIKGDPAKGEKPLNIIYGQVCFIACILHAAL
jgi:hypothetical protein